MTILDDAAPGMNLDIRPQDDLFGYVNGTWLDETEIPSDRSSWGPFVSLADEAEKHVRVIVEACASGEIEGEDAVKIGDLFASFMDEDRAEELGAAPLQPVLAKIDALSDKSELGAFFGAFERDGGGSIFGSYVDNDDRDADRYVVNVVQGGIGLPDESYYREDKHAEIRSKYVDYLEKILDLASQPDARATAEKVFEIETLIAKGHWERAETRDVIKTYNLTTLDEFKAALPSFDIDGYVTAIGGNDQTFAEMIVREPSYLTHLEGVLAATPLEEWKSYLRVKAIRGAAGYLSSAFVEANFDFYGRTLSGTPELRARWKRGVGLVEGALGEAIGREYVARHFPPKAKEMMDELVKNLLEAYRQSISQLDWMGEETKEKAYLKLDTFVPKIGYPEKFKDYSGLAVSKDDLVANIYAISAFETDRQLNKIGSPVDRDEWFMLPQTVNAYYNPGTNEICFPAGILQRPFFSADADLAENYGGIGGVIGHEIGHGFDDQGAQYDGHGNLNDWWTADDKAGFEVKTKALIEQYDAFSPRNVPEEKVNGSLTVGENIGDLGGLTIALKAYNLALDGAEAPVVNGNTGEKRLFLNWAYIWRTKRRLELEKQYLATDPHSPPEFRANIVRNLDEFHEAFGTTEGDGLWLAPEERVRIW